MIAKIRTMVTSGEHNLEIQVSQDEPAFASITQMHSHFSMSILNVGLDDLESMSAAIAQYVADQRATTKEAK
jgi:hypothetical protein